MTAVDPTEYISVPGIKYSTNPKPNHGEVSLPASPTMWNRDPLDATGASGASRPRVRVGP